MPEVSLFKSDKVCWVGALFLDLLDRRIEATGLDYVRFVDDWIVLAPTRWKLRKAVRLVNQALSELQVEQHPDKTFVGRINRGFSFLGYEFNAAGLVGVARPTRERFAQRIRRLYEQGATDSRIGEYVRRWLAWVRMSLPTLSFDFDICFVTMPIQASLNRSAGDKWPTAQVRRRPGR